MKAVRVRRYCLVILLVLVIALCGGCCYCKQPNEANHQKSKTNKPPLEPPLYIELKVNGQSCKVTTSFSKKEEKTITCKLPPSSDLTIALTVPPGSSSFQIEIDNIYTENTTLIVLSVSSEPIVCKEGKGGTIAIPLTTAPREVIMLISTEKGAIITFTFISK